MANRVDYDDVKAIMDGCTTAGATVTIFITSANALINRVFVNDATMTEDMLTEIEKWLAAHLIASTVFRTTSDEKLGDASVKYTGEWGKKLESTPYGQMVLLLDASGLLANAGKMSATITAVNEFDE
jgi:hypothetical protein